MEKQKRLLNIDQAAEYLCLKRGTLYNKAAQKQVPSVKIGGALRFDINQLNEYIERNTIAAKS